MLLHIKGKPEIHRQRKQSSQEFNVRFICLFRYNLFSFHLKSCTFTLSCPSQKTFVANVKTMWISIFWCDTSKLLMLLCKLLIFILICIYFALRFYTAGIYSGQQRKNFIAQGNMLSNCTHDNKHFDFWILNLENALKKERQKAADTQSLSEKKGKAQKQSNFQVYSSHWYCGGITV